jgi:ribosome-interacting GTPase 1
MVDTPPLTPEGMPAGLLNTLRGGDLLLLLVDAGSPDCLEQLEEMISLLLEKRVIQTQTTAVAAGQEDDPPGKYLPYLVLATKTDHPDSAENLQIIRELIPHLPLRTVSTKKEESLHLLKEEIFNALRIIRIYTKAPGKPPDMETPFVLKKGDTILDLAFNIHRDFPNRLKNARVWGSSRFEGQTVARDYILADKDVVELNV